MSNLSRRRSVRDRRGLTVLVLALVVLLTVGGAAYAAGLGAASGKRPGKQLTAYQLRLRAQVQKADGSPVRGFDPAAQRQHSLAAAAAGAVGAGQRAADPAEDAMSDHHHDVVPRDVIDPPSVSGGTSAGCAMGYGKPGAQCVPLRAPGNVAQNCTYVRRLFPAGVAVSGADWLRLDRNRNGVACDRKDR